MLLALLLVRAIVGGGVRTAGEALESSLEQSYVEWVLVLKRGRAEGFEELETAWDAK